MKTVSSPSHPENPIIKIKLIVRTKNNLFIRQNYKKIIENIKRKVGVAGFEPTLYLHDYSKHSD